MFHFAVRLREGLESKRGDPRFNFSGDTLDDSEFGCKKISLANLTIHWPILVV